MDDERCEKPAVLEPGQPDWAGRADDLNRSENPHLQRQVHILVAVDKRGQALNQT
jgi:hypothetical protein